MADNFVPIKRPKPGDGEEELLQMQKEFNEKKFTPCTKVINLRSQKAVDNSSVKKQSKFAKNRNEESQKKRISTSQTCGNVTNINPEQNEANKIDPIHNYAELSTNIVLGNIVERKLDLESFKPNIEKKLEESLHDGFPAAFTSPEMLQDVNSEESLFMRAISKRQVKSLDNFDTKSNVSTYPNSSHVVTGPWADEIHKENIEKLKEMSQDEILSEKKNLESMLDPSTIAFIKSMKNAKIKSKDQILNVCKENVISKEANIKMEIDENKSSNSNKKVKLDETNERNHTQDIEDMIVEELPEPVVDIVKTAEKKGWVHMDDPEPQKVKWMEDLPINNDNNKLPEEPYNARFDFSGTLMPFMDENLTVDKGLHHHGEEPERPGYSLQELLQLSRSASQQQRCTALSVLANILEKTHMGWYDRALQPALLNILNQKNLLLLLRFSLDDTAVAVITAGLQALRAFIFCETDEICLDKIFGFEEFDEPILKPSMNDVENVQELKDHELAQLDTVAAAMRSDIVLRIRYILTEIILPPAGMTAALEILARLARHSHETALNIACTQNLLDVIVRKCIPFSMNQPAENLDSSKPYILPLTAAVRLCRILITYAGRPVVERLKNLQIIHSLLTYINSDASRQEVHLHIESLRLWRLFLHFGIETDSLVGSRISLISQLRLLESTLDLNSASPLKCDYAAALVAITKYDEPLKERVTVLLAKWSTQLKQISTPNWNQTVLIAETLRALNNVAFLQKDWITDGKVFTQLSSSSNLLSELEPSSDRDPSSLPSLGVMTFEGKLQPIMSEHSRIIFLKTAMELFLKNDCNNEIEQILKHANVKNYLRRLKSTEWSLERSWFTRIEYSFLVTIIQAENKLKILEAEINDTIWKICIKLISALPADCAMNVRDILIYSLAPERINLRFLESGLEKLDLSDKYKNIDGIENPSLAVKLFEKYVNPRGKWNEAAMPKDWLYLPLIDTYSRMKNQKYLKSSHILEILNLLKLELIMPELTQNLSVNLRFSRMLLLYLLDTAFMHQPESELPQKIIANLVSKNYKKLDLSGEVPGLNSFTDLFTALCENFLANSYGQDCFAQALLVFVAQRFEVHYRKLLWSEHAGILQYCKLTPDKLIIPYEEYLYPLEKDTSLIEAYITALVRNTIKEEQSPVLYNIALHHAAMYLKGSEKIAVVMRSRVERLLYDFKLKHVAEKLLNYEPSVIMNN